MLSACSWVTGFIHWNSSVSNLGVHKFTLWSQLPTSSISRIFFLGACYFKLIAPTNINILLLLIECTQNFLLRLMFTRLKVTETWNPLRHENSSSWFSILVSAALHCPEWLLQFFVLGSLLPNSIIWPPLSISKTN